MKAVDPVGVDPDPDRPARKKPDPDTDLTVKNKPDPRIRPSKKTPGSTTLTITNVFL